MRTKFLMFFTAMAALSLVACKNKSEHAVQKVKPYKVIKITQQPSVDLYSEYPAVMQGTQDIEIRPMINGYIQKVLVVEGQEVKKGQPLFEIKNPQYAEDVNLFAAQITSAQTAIETAKIKVETTKPLVQKGIVSQYELTKAQLDLDARKADLKQAQANYKNAQINLGYTVVKSPVDGVVGTLPYRLGAYVYSNSPMALTTISNISKMYAYFSINEKQQMQMFASLKGKSFQDKINSIAPVSLILSNGEEYPTKGKIETFSGLVDRNTGGYNVRAGFSNENHLLRSGMSAAIRIPVYLTDVILIPQSATTELQDKRLAYVVGKDQTVTSAEIHVKDVPGGQYFVVTDGLKEGDKVMIEGVGIVPEGTKIKPVLVSDSIQLNK